MLREVGRLFFTTASSGSIQEAGRELAAPERLVELSGLVDTYGSVLHALVQESTRDSISLVELRSREILVCWIAYAVTFAAVGDMHPTTMKQFGVCLHKGDLRYLVLSDKLAVDAMLEVANYLGGYVIPGAAVSPK